MAEQRAQMSEQDREMLQLRYLGEEDSAAPRRSPERAQTLAAEHAWLPERLLARIACWWPDEVDPRRLHSEASRALESVAVTVEREEDLPAVATDAIDRRLRQLLCASEWYRQAVMGQTRSLCEAWRGAIIVGREPVDALLCRRLYISQPTLRERFMEVAVVFAIDPLALLPSGAELVDETSMVLGALPPEQQLAAALYFHQELTYSEIAQVMGIEPVRTQELVGRSAVGIIGEVGLAQWWGEQVTA